MKNPARVAKILLDITLVLLVAGVAGTAAVSIDLSTGHAAVHIVAPTRFAPSHHDFQLTSTLFGTGAIQEVTGFALFDVSFFSWAALLWFLLCLVNFVPAFWIVVLLRRIVKTVSAGDPFADANIDRVRAIGALLIGFWALWGAVQFGLETLVAGTSVMDGFRLASAGEWNYYVLLVGMVIIGMAEVFRHGKQLQADADLTV